MIKRQRRSSTGRENSGEIVGGEDFSSLVHILTTFLQSTAAVNWAMISSKNERNLVIAHRG